jgi:hypothetical protein
VNTTSLDKARLSKGISSKSACILSAGQQALASRGLDKFANAPEY